MAFRLHIKNFQSIAEATVELDGFGVMVGPTNLGKSAVVRALRAWAYNELHPNFIRQGERECVLTGEWDDHPELRSIEFRKAVSPGGTVQTNRYTVTLANGEVVDYPKIGNETPDELKSIGFRKLRTEKDEEFNLNVQSQLEGLFLMTENGPTLTSFLNQIFDIAPYERALGSINADTVKVERAYNEAGKQRIEMEKGRDQLIADVATATALHDTLTAITAEMDEAEAELARIRAGKALLTRASLLQEDCGNLSSEIEHTRDRVLPLVQTLGEALQSHVSAIRISAALTATRQRRDALVPRIAKGTRIRAVVDELTAHFDGLSKARRISAGMVTAAAAKAAAGARLASLAPARPLAEAVAEDLSIVARARRISVLSGRKSTDLAAAGARLDTLRPVRTAVASTLEDLRNAAAIARLAGDLRTAQGQRDAIAPRVQAYQAAVPLLREVWKDLTVVHNIRAAARDIGTKAARRRETTDRLTAARSFVTEHALYSDTVRTGLGSCPTCGETMHSGAHA